MVQVKEYANLSQEDGSDKRHTPKTSALQHSGNSLHATIGDCLYKDGTNYVMDCSHP
jgi:hypothetical protein